MLVSNGELAPIALADAAPTMANAVYYARDGALLTQQFSTYAQIYRTQLWVATLVDKLAFATARLPLKVYQRQDGGGRVDARDSAFGRLIRKPNRLHDPYFFWLWTASTFEIYGEAMWFKLRARPGGPPVELWPVHPSNVQIRRDRETGEVIYSYNLGNINAPIFELPAADVVHFKAYNPENQIRGMSRLEALRPTLVNEDAMQRAQAAIWRNGARPSVTLETDGKLTDPAFTRLKAEWDAAHSGVDQWGKAALLEAGVKATVIQLTAEQMQYIEGRKVNREEACARYDVPPPVVHVLDHATFSNITEQMRSMYRDTMAPRLSLYEAVLDTQLRPDFDPQGNLYAEFLMDDVLRGAFEQRVAAYETMSRIGGMMPAEIRAAENLPDAGPETHRLYVNAATIPLGEVTRRAQMVQQGAEVVPTSQDDQPPPDLPTKALAVCAACEYATGEALSARGLCRSCEGKAARSLARMKPKEIES